MQRSLYRADPDLRSLSFLPQDTAYCPAKNNIMSRSDGSQGTQLVQYEIVARQFSQIFCNMMRYLPEGTYVVCVDTVE